MKCHNTDLPCSSRQQSFQSFRPQLAGDGGAGRFHENRRKKRTKLARNDDSNPTDSHSSFKPKPGKKPQPGAPKITRPCSECGKQFWSWKALFGHMRCHPERRWRGINPPPNCRRPMSSEGLESGPGAKFTEEDHEVATSLVLLSNGPTATETPCSIVDRGHPESCDSIGDSLVSGKVDGVGPSGSCCRFECSSCKRVFGSHQALGGHRASHKNVKGCFAIARTDDESEDPNVDQGNEGDADGELKESREEKMGLVLGHQCSICLRVFSSGQALGGHKRRHWEKGDEPSSQGLNPSITREACVLDLNLPAPIENDGESSSYSSDLALDLRLGI